MLEYFDVIGQVVDMISVKLVRFNLFDKDYDLIYDVFINVNCLLLY
jgi:hypothetical protein